MLQDLLFRKLSYTQFVSHYGLISPHSFCTIVHQLICASSHSSTFWSCVSLPMMIDDFLWSWPAETVTGWIEQQSMSGYKTLGMFFVFSAWRAKSLCVVGLEGSFIFTFTFFRSARVLQTCLQVLLPLKLMLKKRIKEVGLCKSCQRANVDVVSERRTWLCRSLAQEKEIWTPFFFFLHF